MRLQRNTPKGWMWGGVVTILTAVLLLVFRPNPTVGNATHFSPHVPAISEAPPSVAVMPKTTVEVSPDSVSPEDAPSAIDADAGSKAETAYLYLPPETRAKLRSIEEKFAGLTKDATRDPAMRDADIAEQRRVIARAFLADLGEVLTPQELSDYLSIPRYSEELRRALLDRASSDPDFAETERVLRINLFGSGYEKDGSIERWLVNQTDETKNYLASLAMEALADERLLSLQNRLGMTGANSDGTRSIYATSLQIDQQSRQRLLGDIYHQLVAAWMAPPTQTTVRNVVLNANGSADGRAGFRESPIGLTLQQRRQSRN
jgi:hypothetical protein